MNRAAITVLILALTSGFQTRAVVLWSYPDTISVNENGAGADLLGGAVKRDDSSMDTLYFKFQVEPISDENTEPYFAAFELFEDDAERLAVGNALDAWAYSVYFPGAQSSGVPPAGYLDLHSAHPDPAARASHASYQCPRKGQLTTIVCKIQYEPNAEDLVTVWLNPDLGPGANEINQSEALTTRFNVNASFDELRLRHGGKGGGWKFGDLAIATAFSDFVDSSSDRPDVGEANLVQREGSLQFQSWLKHQGLPKVPVNAIQQTKDGYLWAAAGDQITRFDGLKFVPLNGGSEQTNSGNPVIFADSRGALWVAVPGGLEMWQHAHSTLVTTNDGLPGARITALNEDGEGSIWIGTSAGLFIWNSGHLAPFADNGNIRNREITCIFKESSGTMWIVIQHTEIFQFSHGRLESVPGSKQKDWMADVLAILVDKTNRLWIATSENAVLCRDQDGWHRYRIPKHITGSRVNALAEEPDGSIWAGGDGGLFLFSKGKFSAIPTSSNLAGNQVESLFVDREGALWAGTDEGLNRLQHKCLYSLGQSEGLGFGPVQGLAQVSPGVVWAARTGDGIYRWDGRNFSRLRAAGLSEHNAQANALLVAHDGVCWVASRGGLLRYKDPVAAGDEVRWFELPNEDIISLAEDGDGSLWAGTRAGNLLRLSEGKWIAQQLSSGSSPVNAILPDPDGSVWIGTGGSGLIHLKQETAKLVAMNDGLPSEFVRALFLDEEGVLWIGTAGGLSCLRGGKISNFTVRDGLPESQVSQILEDDLGRLWLGTSRGIVCVRKSQLEDFAAGKIESLHPKVFNHVDGMASEECTGGFWPAALKSHQGMLWFATTKGVVVIAPQDLPVERPMPNTAIEEIRLDGVPVSADAISGPLSIPPGRHRVEFDYTGMRFDSPETLRFRYKLEGWDSDWIDAGTGRSAVYSLVPAGQYCFNVIACDSDGNWATTGDQFNVIFKKYFWQSWWFLGIASFSLLSAVGGTVLILERQKARARLKRLEQERLLERERTRIAQDLHDEMGAKLCRISFLSEHARRDGFKPSELQEQIQSISDDSREVLHSLDEIVWAVNPQNDTLEHAASYIAQFAQEYFSMTGIECELVVPAQMPAHPVSSQARHHLFLAVRESLANVLKHSAATRVIISMGCQNRGFEIKVQDDGKGFTPNQHTGDGADHELDLRDGLRNMTGRFSDVGGECFIESKVGKGTTVRFILPLEHAGETS